MCENPGPCPAGFKVESEGDGASSALQEGQGGRKKSPFDPLSSGKWRNRKRGKPPKGTRLGGSRRWKES